jgi:chemotaxis signal transduction protein
VAELKSQNRQPEALAVINQTRAGELSTMVRLFQETRDMIRGTLREIVMIVESNGRRFGLVVDSVSEVVDIADELIEPPPAQCKGQEARFVKGLGHVGDQVKILLNVNELIDSDEAKGIASAAD